MAQGKSSRRSFMGAVAAVPAIPLTAASAAEAAASKKNTRKVAPPPMSTADIKPWLGTCAQVPSPNFGQAKSKEDAREALAKHMPKMEGVIRNAADRGSDLVLFPEFSLGSAGNDLKGVLDYPGPEIEKVQKIAQAYKTYIGTNVYARSKDFPGRYLNTSLLINKSGDVVLVSYRLHTYHSNSPHDFWQRFLDKVGIEGAFPVARTELGNISMLPSMDFMFPELSRIFALRGCETLLHTTSENIVDVCTKRTRATENMMYVMSANGPSMRGQKSMEVGSKIIDFEGEVMAGLNEGVDGTCQATIDIEGLRRRRSDPDTVSPQSRGFLGANYLSRLRIEAYREVYDAVTLYPADTYKEGTVMTAGIDPGRNPENLVTSLQNMVQAGLISPKYVKKPKAGDGPAYGGG